MHAQLTWVHGSVLCPLQPSVLLLVARSTRKVNDEPGIVLSLPFLSISFGNDQKLLKNCNFSTFGQKQCFYLAHSGPEYFEKLPIKKDPTLNGLKQLNITMCLFVCLLFLKDSTFRADQNMEHLFIYLILSHNIQFIPTPTHPPSTRKKKLLNIVFISCLRGKFLSNQSSPFTRLLWHKRH